MRKCGASGQALGVQLEVGHNLRWNSDKIMRRAAINDKRIYHLSLVNGHLSFGRCKPFGLCGFDRSAENTRKLAILRDEARNQRLRSHMVPQNDN
jgi:hypothetical protein